MSKIPSNSESGLFRSGSDIALNAQECAQELKTLHEIGLSDIVFIEGSKIYKFKFNEIEYCWSDEAGNFFKSSDPQQATILNPQFYQDLGRFLDDERKKALILAIKNDDFERVKNLLESGVRPFYEKTEDLANGVTYTKNQDIIDLVNRYKIIWIIPQIIEEEVKKISESEIRKACNHQDFAIFLKAIQKLQQVWLGSMDENGQVNSAEIADILMGKGVGGYTASNIMEKFSSLDIEEQGVLFSVILNSDFSSYDEKKLQEEGIVVDFTRNMVQVMSALHNIFDERNRENFLKIMQEMEREIEEEGVPTELGDDESFLPRDVRGARATAIASPNSKKCAIL